MPFAKFVATSEFHGVTRLWKLTGTSVIEREFSTVIEFIFASAVQIVQMDRMPNGYSVHGRITVVCIASDFPFRDEETSKLLL